MTLWVYSLFALILTFQLRAVEITRLSNQWLKLKNQQNQDHHQVRFKILQQHFRIKNLRVMDQKQLTHNQQRITHSWQGYSWPYRYGAVSFRYAHPDYSSPSSSFRLNLRKYSQLSTLELVNSGQVDLLSPAEKYDVLLGDKNLSLSQAQWTLAAKEVRGEGIPSWIGLCHGWSAASGSTWIPRHTVKAKSAWKDDLWINFTPTDITALATLLWSHGQYLVDVIGDRCENRKSGPCGRDLRPDGFHQAVVNIIGDQKKFLVMDYSRNHVVNNMPIIKYEYQYLNMKHPDKPVVERLAEAMATKNSLAKRSWRKGRRSRVKFVVGIKLNYYVHEDREPSEGTQDQLSQKSMSYDLELDQRFNIIGGRWHEGKIPDFIWYPSRGEKAHSMNDRRIKGNYSIDFPPAKEISQYSSGYTMPNGIKIKGSSELGQPLGIVVDELVEQGR